MLCRARRGGRARGSGPITGLFGRAPAPIGGQITRESAEEQVAQSVGRTRSGAYGLRRAGRAVALGLGFTVPALAGLLLLAMVTEDRWMGQDQGAGAKAGAGGEEMGVEVVARPRLPCLIW
jgi:hypothetical protein